MGPCTSSTVYQCTNSTVNVPASSLSVPKLEQELFSSLWLPTHFPLGQMSQQIYTIIINATEDNATMILFRRIPQTPFFPVFSWSNWFCCCSWKLLGCCVGKQCKMVIDQDACLDRLTDSLSWSSIREGLSQRHFPIDISHFQNSDIPEGQVGLFFRKVYEEYY